VHLPTKLERFGAPGFGADGFAAPRGGGTVADVIGHAIFWGYKKCLDEPWDYLTS